MLALSKIRPHEALSAAGRSLSSRAQQRLTIKFADVVKHARTLTGNSSQYSDRVSHTTREAVSGSAMPAQILQGAASDRSTIWIQEDRECGSQKSPSGVALGCFNRRSLHLRVVVPTQTNHENM